MTQYFPKIFIHFNGNVKNEINLSNYAIKTDVERATGGDTQHIRNRLILIKDQMLTNLQLLQLS